MPPKLPRGHLAASAYEQIKSLLLEGRFRSDERFSVETIGSELQASRQPVTEALKRLAAEGFIEIVPQVGCRILLPPAREIGDFFRLFAATEGLCAELAAQRASADEHAALARVMAPVRVAGRGITAAERGRRYRAHNRQFHAQIHAMAHSATLHDLAGSMWDRADFLINNAIGAVPFESRAPDAVEEHQGILAAIARGDATLARRRMEEHVFAFVRLVDQAEELSKRNSSMQGSFTRGSSPLGRRGRVRPP